MNILVMGGSYFVGRHIVRALLAGGHSVTVLNRGSKPAPAGCAELTCDREDALALRRALAGRRFEAVVDVSGLCEKHVRFLCEALEPQALRSFVFISSSAVYDLDHCAAPLGEEAPLAENRHWGAYGRDKIEAERWLAGHFAQSGVSLALLRPPYLYGEENYLPREGFLFDRILRGQPVLVPANDPLLQFCYAGDLGDFVRRLIERPQPGARALNVGDQKPLSAQEWVQACAQAAQKPVTLCPVNCTELDIAARAFFPLRDYDNVLRVEAARELGFCETPIAEGLRRAFAWYLEHREQFVPTREEEERQQQILRRLSV